MNPLRRPVTVESDPYSLAVVALGFVLLGALAAVVVALILGIR